MWIIKKDTPLAIRKVWRNRKSPDGICDVYIVYGADNDNPKNRTIIKFFGKPNPAITTGSTAVLKTCDPEIVGCDPTRTLFEVRAAVFEEYEGGECDK